MRREGLLEEMRIPENTEVAGIRRSYAPTSEIEHQETCPHFSLFWAEFLSLWEGACHSSLGGRAVTLGGLFLLKTCVCVCVCMCLLCRATPMAFGNAKAKGQIRASAAHPHHSYRNLGSEPLLWPTPQLMATLDPRPTGQGQGWNLQPHGCVSPRIHFHHTTVGTPLASYF